jgi:hypothetical protein
VCGVLCVVCCVWYTGVLYTDDATLSRSVVGLAGVSDLADDRGDVDDAARALLEHALARLGCAEEDTLIEGLGFRVYGLRWRI